jgi:hypothetical protein
MREIAGRVTSKQAAIPPDAAHRRDQHQYLAPAWLGNRL